MISATLVLLFQAFALTGAGAALAGPVGSEVGALFNVFVTNDSNNPVPVTGTVDLGNTPTVKAQQDGSWTVSLNGTPVVGIDPSGNTVKLDPNGNTVKLDSTANTVTVGNTPTVNVGNEPTVKLDTNGSPVAVQSSVQTQTVYDSRTTDPGSITLQSGDSRLGSGAFDVSQYEKIRVYVDERPDSNSDVTFYVSVPMAGGLAQVGTLHVSPNGNATAEFDVPGTQIYLDASPDGSAPDYIDVAVFGR